MEQTAERIQYLDNIGTIGLGVDTESHDLVIMLKTPVGTVSSEMSKERALQLGITLIRLSGRSFKFTQPPVVGPPPESRQEDGDEKASSGPGSDPGAVPDRGEPGGGPADTGAQGEGGAQGAGERPGGRDKDRARAERLGIK